MADLDAPLETFENPDNDSNDPDNTSKDNTGELTPEMVDVEMSKFFGFKPGDLIDNADKDYMQTIWNYYADGAKTSGEVIRKISAAEREIAPPQPGESRLGKFYTFVRLLEESKGIKDEIRAYKR